MGRDLNIGSVIEENDGIDGYVTHRGLSKVGRNGEVCSLNYSIVKFAKIGR